MRLETVVDGRAGLVHGHGDRHALAGSQSVRLHHEWRALSPHIGLGFRRIVEALIGAGRDIVFGAEILGEALRALKLCGSGRGTEDGNAFGAQRVGQACDQRRFRPDDDEGDRLFAAE